MWIKYDDHMINLDNVTDIVKCEDKRIDFYHIVPTSENYEFQSKTFFKFSSTENRDKAFHNIYLNFSNIMELKDD